MADLYLIEFKGHRKEFFYNKYYHDLSPDDPVIIQAERGEDAGVVAQQIERGKTLDLSSKPRSILRPASDEDIDRITEVRNTEHEYKTEVIEIIRRHSLTMKVVDVEIQFDGNKMTVFFTADQRVDFRALVKELASRYKTRIEMRQIGVRDEARRIGGFGICGKEQCCSSFLGEFTPISTQDARVQDLALNPSKISGNCGRLLCCLKYEASLYSAAKRKFPRPGKFVRTDSGEGYIERIDYFREEAVIHGRDGETFRVRADQITRVEDKTTAPSDVSDTRPTPAYDAGVEYESAAVDELKKLDEPEDIE